TERIEDSHAIPMALPESTTWFKPTYWNVGGYDAIMVLKKTQTVRFVQLAASLQQPFHIEYFLKSFVESPEGFKVEKLEIFFVAEEANKRIFAFTSLLDKGY
ncbi:hypothetical protein F442_17560, partial [Phytophthora nicotianae P10297]